MKSRTSALVLRLALFQALFITTFSLCPVPSTAQATSVTQFVDSVLDRPDFKGGIQGCIVTDAATGQVLYERNPDTRLMPASNMKVFTSAAALEVLGPDFRYTTRVGAIQPVNSQGALEGDLVIAGSGDPLLDMPALHQIIETLKKVGLKKVTGAVVADTGNFSRSPYGWGWSWDYLQDYYAAPVGAFNLNKNVVRVRVQPGDSPGSSARVVVEPASSHLRVSNWAITGSATSEKQISVSRELGQNVLRVSGSVPAGTTSTDADAVIAVYNPAQFAADVFHAALVEAGIEVAGRPRLGANVPMPVELAVHVSPPMSEILVQFNKWSDNLTGEALIRTMGSVKRGDGSFGVGRQVAEEFYRKAGMDTTGHVQTDGSGLARMNQITPRNMAVLLRYMDNSPNRDVYLNTLPIAGVDGTLRNRMKGTPAENNARAKTGYIGNVSSLSGYVDSKAGQRFIFSVIFNHHYGTTTPCRQAQDDIAAWLAGLTEKL